MSERAMPTMGPVHVLCLSIGQHGHEVRIAPNGRIIARLPRSGEWRKADADLIAAAFNAATEARAMGFDPIGAIQQLPKLLQHANAVYGASDEYAEVGCDEDGGTVFGMVFDADAMKHLGAALSAARTREVPE